MSETPCQRNDSLRENIEQFAEILKTQAHTLPGHSLTQQEFYDSGLFRGAIERLRGQFSATMREKHEFARNILNFLQDQNYIAEWESAGSSNRHDYLVTFSSGRIAAIELKGCLDGNNTNIFERPPQAHEFVIWSICTNPGADPRHNVWSGIHARLSAEIISREQRVDGLIVWDMACGTVGRPCPKIQADPTRITVVNQYRLPPPCLYLFPGTVPNVRNNPSPRGQPLENSYLLKAFFECFRCQTPELNYVDFDVENRDREVVRRTTIRRGGAVQRSSDFTSIRRT